MMDAIRAYAENDDLIFVVDALYVHNDGAVADVHPTPETDDGLFGRKWISFRRDEDFWFADDGVNAEESNIAVARDRWSTWASEELLDEFFAERPAQPERSGVGVLTLAPEEQTALSADEIKAGFVFALRDARVIQSRVYDKGSGNLVPSSISLDYNWFKVVDGRRVMIFCDEEMSVDPTGREIHLQVASVDASEHQIDV